MRLVFRMKSLMPPFALWVTEVALAMPPLFGVVTHNAMLPDGLGDIAWVNATSVPPHVLGRLTGVPIHPSPDLRRNGLQLQEVGDFGDENCLPALNLIRSTKLHLTTEPPISCRCC
jgi:hypothetical protein